MVTRCVHWNMKGQGLCAFTLWKQDLLLPGPLWLAIVGCCHGKPLYPDRLHSTSLRRPLVVTVLVLQSAISCKERRDRHDQSGSRLDTHRSGPETLTRPVCFSASHQFCRNPACRANNLNRKHARQAFVNTVLFFRYSYGFTAVDCKWRKSESVSEGKPHISPISWSPLEAGEWNVLSEVPWNADERKQKLYKYAGQGFLNPPKTTISPGSRKSSRP